MTYFIPAPALVASNARRHSAIGTTSETNGSSSTSSRFEERHGPSPRSRCAGEPGAIGDLLVEDLIEVEGDLVAKDADVHVPRRPCGPRTVRWLPLAAAPSTRTPRRSSPRGWARVADGDGCEPESGRDGEPLRHRTADPAQDNGATRCPGRLGREDAHRPGTQHQHRVSRVDHRGIKQAVGDACERFGERSRVPRNVVRQPMQVPRWQDQPPSESTVDVGTEGSTLPDTGSGCRFDSTYRFRNRRSRSRRRTSLRSDSASTPSPTERTSPVTSWPIVTGGWDGNSSSAMWRSVPQMPAEITSSSTCPGQDR